MLFTSKYISNCYIQNQHERGTYHARASSFAAGTAVATGTSGSAPHSLQLPSCTATCLSGRSCLAASSRMHAVVPAGAREDRAVY